MRNGLVELAFSRAQGGLASIKVGAGPTVPVSLSLRAYSHRLATTILPWFLRRSGHYAFHPAGEAVALGGGGAAAGLTITAGPHLTEVGLSAGPYASLAIRLRSGAVAPEVEWTVGPLPDAQDVVLRVDSALSTGSSFFTDANGREYLRRTRGERATFIPAPIEAPYANPIGRDYYPTTVGAYLADEAAGLQLSLLSDRAQGASSLASGSLEVMLHREAEMSDELGNPETLQERLGGVPIIVRGVSMLVVSSAADGPALRRDLASKTYHAPQVVVAARAGAVESGSASLLTRDLPPQIDVLKLGASDGGAGLDLRVMHTFGEKEHGALSTPVDVDVAAAFAAPLAALAVEPATPAGLPLEAVVAPPKALRRGERIFAGPKLFDFDDLSKAGVDVPGVAPVAAPPLIPRPPAIAKGPAKRGVLRVNPLEIKAVVLRGHGGGTGVA